MTDADSLMGASGVNTAETSEPKRNRSTPAGNPAGLQSENGAPVKLPPRLKRFLLDILPEVIECLVLPHGALDVVTAAVNVQLDPDAWIFFRISDEDMPPIPEGVLLRIK